VIRQETFEGPVKNPFYKLSVFINHGGNNFHEILPNLMGQRKVNKKINNPKDIRILTIHEA